MNCNDNPYESSGQNHEETADKKTRTIHLPRPIDDATPSANHQSPNRR
jgi:hypothetical protein